ncbi:MAG: putative LPS assembly protein LptD [Ignavibacteriaceae bacterium]
MKLSFLIILSLSLLTSCFAFDSNSTFYFYKDSLRAPNNDTLASKDTSGNPSLREKKKGYDIDSVIYASSSDSLLFFVNQKKMNIYGQGELKYKDMDLKSAKIFVDFTTSNVDAFGIPNDSLSNKFKETPVLSQSGEVYNGESMRYNFKTARGFISTASTKMESSYYTGEKINKVDKDTYFIKDGIYTTCDANPPDYYFYSPEMKVIQKKEIVAKWIWLFFGGVPFPVPIPFAVFPIESGRRSGILVPAFGNSQTYGYYFSRFGYFWAINDFMDLNLTGDYYTRGSYKFNSRFRYAKRYEYSGSLEGGYSFFKNGESTDPGSNKEINWNIAWSHNQTITPTLHLVANLQFTSNNYLKTNVGDINQQLQNQIVSNVTLSKTWDESGNSLYLNYNRVQDLQTGNISEILPSLTFTIPETYPFRRQGIHNDQQWYELIGFQYTGQFQNDRNKVNGDLSIRGGIQHNLNISASPKIGYISLTPNINYQENWYNKRIEENYAGIAANGSDSIVTNDVKQINFVRTFSMGVAASTRFYGIFQPDIFGISAFRQTVIPIIAYNFRPDFSKPMWNYYGTYKSSNGQTISYDKFQREINAPSLSGEQQNISLSIQNIFEMKTKADPTDTTSKENKIQLLNLNTGLSYNFAADSLKFSDITIDARTQVGQYLNLHSTSTFSMYDYAPGISRINKFLVDEGKGLLRLTSFNFSVSTNLSGEKLKSAESKGKNNSTESAYTLNQTDKTVYQGIYNNKEANYSIPWNLYLSYNFFYSKIDPLNPSRTSNMSASLDFNLTPMWKLSFAGSYDFEQKQFAAPQIRISRDLHCWEMNFTWNPIGTYSGYYFEIRVKAPQLQDLKVTKRDEFYNGK